MSQSQSMRYRLRYRRSRVAMRAVAEGQRFLDRGHRHVLLACAPKSGSSLLIELLLAATGFERCNPLAAGGRHENNLYEPGMIDAMGRSTAAQVHALATEHNLELIERYGHTPIVLNRNLADTLVSLRDHMNREGTRWSMLWADDRFCDRTPEEQLDQLIDLAAPWFVNFHVSWSEAAASSVALWLHYDELAADPGAALHRVSDACDLGLDQADIDSAVTALSDRDTRFNVGRAGRGAEILTSAHHERLASLASHYPWVDFAPLGLAR